MNKFEYNMQYAQDVATSDNIFVPINILRELIEYPALPAEIADQYDKERKLRIKSNIANHKLMNNLFNSNKS